MKEWLVKMAKELGLPDGAAESEILAKLSERILGGDAKLSGVAAQLAAHGLKLDGEKVVKLERQSNPEDAARIAALELDNVKGKIAAGKAELNALIAAGKVPPAMKDRLEKLFCSTGKVESLSLSKQGDSEVVIKGTIEILSDLKALFDSLPPITGKGLSTLPVAGGQPGTEGNKAVGQLGRSVAARVQRKPVKEPAAQ